MKNKLNNAGGRNRVWLPEGAGEFLVRVFAFSCPFVGFYPAGLSLPVFTGCFGRPYRRLLAA